MTVVRVFTETNITPERWMQDAACATTDPELFFPEREEGGGTAAHAKRICARCDVRDKCLEYALRNGETEGIWGGLSSRQRRRLPRVRVCRTCGVSIADLPAGYRRCLPHAEEARLARKREWDLECRRA